MLNIIRWRLVVAVCTMTYRDSRPITLPAVPIPFAKIGTNRQIAKTIPRFFITMTAKIRVLFGVLGANGGLGSMAYFGAWMHFVPVVALAVDFFLTKMSGMMAELVFITTFV